MMSLVDVLYDAISKKRKITCIIGDLITDMWVRGRVSKCQDGCMKFTSMYEKKTLGGAGNAANCLSHWHARTAMYGRCNEGSVVKTRFVDDATGTLVFRWDQERQTEPLQHEHDLALEMVSFSAGVLLSDYDKGFLTLKFIRSVICTCLAHGIPCVADCKQPPEVYRGAILKCNSEYQLKYNKELSEMVYDSAAPHSLVVTDGPLTPAVWNKGVIQKGFPFLPPVTCINHVGAGDCFASHLTLALGHGFSLKDACQLAHSAGRVYVQHAHNRPPFPAEIVVDMEQKAPAECISAGAPASGYTS